ncbi:MAG: helix-turn-helix domain-containing protein [Candidatus Paceibacterota bacterium]|jgi:hypothetical protein
MARSRNIKPDYGAKKDAPDFVVVPMDVVLDRRLTLRQMRVLMALFSFRSKTTNTVWPSREAIAKRTHLDIATISSATTDLVRLGWLMKAGTGGHSKATRYTLCVPEIEHETVTECATVSKPTTVAECATVEASEIVAESTTVAECATVAEYATPPLAHYATPPLAHYARGKEQTIEHTNEQTISRPAKKPVAAKPVKKTADEHETELQAACKKTWGEYSAAFERRYGTRPVRNASVNAKVRQFVQRIGYDESPAVAGFYVDRVTDPFVLRKVHDVGLLLSGAEGYRTQWASGRTTAEPNRQEALETRNRNIAADWAAQGETHAAV